MRRAALTKTDVFIALACVALLLANLGAVAGGGRRRAKETVCVSNLKRWGTVWKAFVDDNEGWFTEDLWWMAVLETYYENHKLLLCPEAARPQAPVSQGTIYGGKFNAWVTDYDDRLYIGSYGQNQWCRSGAGCARMCDMIWETPHVKSASEIPLLMDCAFIGLTPLPYDEPPRYDGDFTNVGNVDEMKRACVNRHNGAVNVLFLDFSVRKVGLKYLWLLDWHRDWPIPETISLPYWPYWMENFKDP
ncbi:MAG: hypothetical protein ACYTEL_15610 [Planctomycetota bacterium]|jgi:prepilin-type processing-associated H-X9-DG protein